MRVFTEERGPFPFYDPRVVCVFTLDELAEALGCASREEMTEDFKTPLDAILDTWKLKLDE